MPLMLSSDLPNYLPVQNGTKVTGPGLAQPLSLLAIYQNVQIDA